jgi:hypothetical protein
MVFAPPSPLGVATQDNSTTSSRSRSTLRRFGSTTSPDRVADQNGGNDGNK